MSPSLPCADRSVDAVCTAPAAISVNGQTSGGALYFYA
jgi:hypothetical protein